MSKIVILTDSICKIGGIESLIHLKATYWVKNMNHEVHIITTEQLERDPFFKMDKRIHHHDLNIAYNRNASYFGRFNLLKVISNYFKLSKLLIKLKPDVSIIANHIPVTFFFIFLRVKTKWVKEFHFSKFFRVSEKKTIFRKYEEYLESKFDTLVVLNKEETGFYNFDNVVAIPNPIKIEIDYLPKSENRKKIAMAAGRLTTVKRIDLMVEIWAKFTKLNKEWKLHIYGDGEASYVEMLKKKIAAFGISDRIELIGAVDNIQELMSEVGIYLMTSSQECFPMVLLEAQSAGLPIIAFDCPTGPRNIITNGYNGILVPMDDQDAYVENLSMLTKNEALRLKLASNGFDNVKQYDIDKIMTRWENNVINN